MYGNIIALCVLAMPVVALAAMAAAWSPAENDFSLRAWPTVWFPVIWLALWTPGFVEQRPDRINPFFFWIPLLSWLGVSLFCKLGKVRRGGLTALVVLLAVAVTVPQLVSEEWDTGMKDQSNQRVLTDLQERLRAGGREISDNWLPKGWIDRPPLDALWKPDRAITRLGLDTQRIHTRAWHTWLTGLYHVKSVPAGVWYPGGKPAEVANKLEWRPR